MTAPTSSSRRLETILRNQLGEGHYVTIFYGVIDLSSRILNYVNAGHCPPILRHADGSLQSLSSTRPVLGLILDAEFRSERLRLSAGDRLLLYTDGVTEAGNDAGEEFGVERLTSLMERQSEQPLPEQFGSIMDSVRGHAGGNFGDDATLLLISDVASFVIAPCHNLRSRQAAASSFPLDSSSFNLKLET